VTAAAVLAVHTALTVGDWWRLSSETQQLKTQMERQFREIFPDTQAVVNAPLQMQRSLGRLRREAGVPDASDFIPLLAAVAPSLSAAGLHTERMRYERGTLEVDVSMPAEAGRETLEKQLHVPGYRVRVDRMSTGPSGSVATVLVSAEA
jgi:type II secretory pathway component PulL